MKDIVSQYMQQQLLSNKQTNKKSNWAIIEQTNKIKSNWAARKRLGLLKTIFKLQQGLYENGVVYSIY